MGVSSCSLRLLLPGTWGSRFGLSQRSPTGSTMFLLEEVSLVPQYWARLGTRWTCSLPDSCPCWVARSPGGDRIAMATSASAIYQAGPGFVPGKAPYHTDVRTCYCPQCSDGNIQDHTVNDKFALIQLILLSGLLRIGGGRGTTWISCPLCLPRVLGSGPTWCEPRQLGRTGLMNPADKGHHLHALLLSVVKAISL